MSDTSSSTRPSKMSTAPTFPSPPPLQSRDRSASTSSPAPSSPPTHHLPIHTSTHPRNYHSNPSRSPTQLLSKFVDVILDTSSYALIILVPDEDWSTEISPSSIAFWVTEIPINIPMYRFQVVSILRPQLKQGSHHTMLILHHRP